MTQISLEEQIKQLQVTLQNIQVQVAKEKLQKSDKEEIVKVCKHCGKQFTTTKRNKKYCSEECKLAEIKEKQKIYNKTCYARSTKPKRQEKAIEKLTERICPICGSKFLGKGNKKYCSEECKTKGRILINRRTSNNPKNKAKVIAIAKLQRKMLPTTLIRDIANGKTSIKELNNLWNLQEIKTYLKNNNLL